MNITRNDKKGPNSGTQQADVGQTNRPAMDEVQGQSSATADDVLISRSRAGQVSAFGQLVERYQGRLFNAIHRMVGNTDDAQELTQDAFVRAFQGLRKFRGGSGFYTWLFRIGMNLSINHRHRRQRMQLVPSDNLQGTQADSLAALAGGEDSASHRLEMQEEHQRVLAALEELEPSFRVVVVLRDIEGLDYAQIGKLLEVPVGTVKSRLSRARLMLREKLLGVGGESESAAT